ncbi:uncharacterized protein LOC119725683 [Patiria miniata]|uniref:Uncharacterized protein n=1 Tax=Patiria miniata TaxID=46514 RepID=A0A913ZN16_PATMI|nr:uncharacterized protein LOC119725683 [Patiria miniata]
MRLSTSVTWRGSMRFRVRLGAFLVSFLVFALNEGLCVDLQGPGVITSQSSDGGVSVYAEKAADGRIDTLARTGWSESARVNPWWKVDMGAIYCLRKISLVNRISSDVSLASRVRNNVIRAGLSSQHLLNQEIGRVSEDQAISGAVLDFLPDPYVTARYVSVDIPGSGADTIVQLVEVMIEEVTVDTIQTDTPTALTLTGLATNQSSIDMSGSWEADRAIDGSSQYDDTSCSRTNVELNPWWHIDLNSPRCVGKIAIRNIDDIKHTTRLELEGAVVRAGLDATPTANPTCGSPVSQYQALINDWIEFTCDPSRLARYVSVDVPTETALTLCEVMIWPCDLPEIAIALADRPGSQSSTMNSQGSTRALDGLPEDPFCSLTNYEENPWWTVDLESNNCLGKIQVRNTGSAEEPDLLGAVVRAGLSEVPTDNNMCGSPVTGGQSVKNDWVEFTCDPPVLARYVSVDIPGMASLKVCEVVVATCDFQPEVNKLDFTLVTNPALVGITETEDDNATMTAYKGPGDITASVSFGRQLTTGGNSGELPSGSMVSSDPSTGCAARLILRLPEEGGIDRAGVFYSEAISNDITTRIQTVILPREDATHLSPVERTQTASIEDSVVLQMRDVNSPNTNYRWRRNGSDVIEAWNGLLNVAIPNVTKEDEGVYSCFALDQEDEQLHGIMRLIVRGCSAGHWDPPSCLKTCRRCFNGGVCDDESGTCVCATGFSGDNCEQAHGRNVFGKTADQRCSNSTDPHHEACRGRLFCLPDPYGCSCAAGYMGLDCMQECLEGTFGADCKQTCHCTSGGTCNKDTGECSSGCEAPYFGSNCQCSTQNSVVGLEATTGGPHQLFVAWQPDACSSGYELTTTDDCGNSVSQELPMETTYHFITDLGSPLNYRVHIRPLYPGDVQGPEMASPPLTTRAPSESPTEVNSISVTSSSLSFSWSKPPCGSRGGIITGYTYILTEVGPPSTEVVQSVTSEESVTIQGLSPLTEYSFQVAASTTAGAGPYSGAVRTTTSLSVTVSPTDRTQGPISMSPTDRTLGPTSLAVVLETEIATVILLSLTVVSVVV